MKPKLLYKVHEVPACETLLSITRYMYSKGVDMRPLYIVETNFPSSITTLPTIVLNNDKQLTGLHEIVKYYENTFKIENLIEKSKLFMNEFPNYRIVK